SAASSRPELVEFLLGLVGGLGAGVLIDDLLEPRLGLVGLAVLEQRLGEVEFAGRLALGLVGVGGFGLGVLGVFRVLRLRVLGLALGVLRLLAGRPAALVALGDLQPAVVAVFLPRHDDV